MEREQIRPLATGGVVRGAGRYVVGEGARPLAPVVVDETTDGMTVELDDLVEVRPHFLEVAAVTLLAVIAVEVGLVVRRLARG